MIPLGLIVSILAWELRLCARMAQFTLGVILAPITFAWLGAPGWAEHPSAWRKASRKARLTIITTATAGCIAVAFARNDLVMLLLPARWPETLIAMMLWWAALVPIAVIVARLRVRSQGDALAGGRVDPTRADVIRSAAWEAQLQDLSTAAGVDVLSRPPRVLQPLHVPCDILGVTAVHDTRRARERSWTHRESRSAASSWRESSRSRNQLLLPGHPPRVVMLGGSGSGKTVAQHRMVISALSRGWRVLWLDGKGDPRDALQLSEQALACGRCTRWLNLAAPGGRDAYDLWRGEGSAVARKAAALMPRSGSGGTEHYAAWESYALTTLAEPPWRSSAELLSRMRTPASYVGTGESGRRALATLTTKQSGTRMIDSIAAQVTAAITPLAQFVDGQHGHAWSLDDDSEWDLAIASIDPGAAAGAERVAAALLLDLDAYRIARRSADARPLLVVADELGGVLSDPRVVEAVPRLMEQVRSQGIGLVVAAQSVQTLGDCGPRLLGAGVDLWVGRIDSPDDVAMLIGTTKVTEQAHQGNQHGALLSGRTAAREQDALMVHPQLLRELPTWTWLVKEPRTEPHWAVVPPLPPTASMPRS
jgi:hypothetical protein